MNLYEIQFTHYAPKDSESGILGYFAGDSDEDVYEWLKTEPELNKKTIYNSYLDNEEDEKEYKIYDENYNVIDKETFKERMIRLHGEMYDDDYDICDTFYGVTTIGWELRKENVTNEEISIIKYLNIPIISKS